MPTGRKYERGCNEAESFLHLGALYPAIRTRWLNAAQGQDLARVCTPLVRACDPNELPSHRHTPAKHWHSTTTQSTKFSALATPKMDLFNRPPTIAEDTVIYTLYPPPGTDKSGVTSLSTLIATHVREALLPANHIWHRDAFDLRVIDDSHSSNSNSNTKIYLQGTVRVGDCVDDEWCIVWLLYQISQKFDVVIRCAAWRKQFIRTLLMILYPSEQRLRLGRGVPPHRSGRASPELGDSGER